MEWKKYQIKAVVETVLIRVDEKVKAVKDKLLKNFIPTSKQQEIMDDFDSLVELLEEKEAIEKKVELLKSKINKSTRKEIGNESFSWSIYSSNYVKEAKDGFIDKIIDKNLPHIPDYDEVERKLTLCTLSAGFDIEAWIQNFVDGIKCEE